jgi:hypothetical protein
VVYKDINIKPGSKSNKVDGVLECLLFYRFKIVPVTCSRRTAKIQPGRIAAEGSSVIRSVAGHYAFSNLHVHRYYNVVIFAVGGYTYPSFVSCVDG